MKNTVRLLGLLIISALGMGCNIQDGFHGRYQIVNATPTFRGSTMLLDTDTGTSWLVCEYANKDRTTETGWCLMPGHFDPKQ